MGGVSMTQNSKERIFVIKMWLVVFVVFVLCALKCVKNKHGGNYSDAGVLVEESLRLLSK